MTTFEAIKLLIEEDVRCDIHGDLYGHERVAEHLAERIDALVKENKELKAKLAAKSWDGSVDRQGGSFTLIGKFVIEVGD